jgi:hypothetical protein
VAPSGVWVIDAKRYEGRVRRHDGGFVPCTIESCWPTRSRLPNGVREWLC